MASPDLLGYRPCVGIMLINKAGLVWVGKRDSGKGKTEPEYAWQMPQGGIDKGESPIQAAKRELEEETSVSNISLLAEAPEWLSYDLPSVLNDGKPWRGKFRGQSQKWFAFRFDGADEEINILEPTGGHTPEFSEWRWESAHRLPSLIVPFKRDVYEQIVETFAKHTK
ncbi:MAG: RNA pyrophosphohydrolase [Stappiaceae bacterium]